MMSTEQIDYMASHANPEHLNFATPIYQDLALTNGVVLTHCLALNPSLTMTVYQSYPANLFFFTYFLFNSKWEYISLDNTAILFFTVLPSLHLFVEMHADLPASFHPAQISFTDNKIICLID